MSKDQYRWVEDDENYIENWVQQYDLICVEKIKIGFIGSLYWSGVLTLVIVLPWIADKYGRRWVFIAAYGLFLIFAALILSMENLTALYVVIFLTGGTIGGRVIVANNFFMEYFEMRIKDIAIFIRFFSQMLLTLLYTAWL